MSDLAAHQDLFPDLAPPGPVFEADGPEEMPGDDFFAPLTPFCADLIVCDYPSNFELRSVKGHRKSAHAHYRCMSHDAIKAMPVGRLAGRDCWLFLWATAPLLDTAVETMKCWGFRYLTFTVWRKVTVNGKRAMGTGYVARSEAEIVLIGAIGDPVRLKPIDGIFNGVRREHSRKPEEFYERVERFAPHARKVDLFGRQSRPGWLVFGNEATKFDDCAAGMASCDVRHP